ncbi:hypothetical protein Mame_00322 [Martelella mediterranea DSM 17316]|uniref:Uncharacterized protein n=1 Tax=Martelella mediterranea DSM 17316 TaxID=1122214 RepID=A0A1U9YW86_9HYPH|nr:hypothetical protein Mame_00322 [Martelella mediterranea DSM 17316]|tara:strand:+ start:228 stop:338 length:111 start_codon:yes stop_codon:yes gene_type:complete
MKPARMKIALIALAAVKSPRGGSGPECFGPAMKGES